MKRVFKFKKGQCWDGDEEIIHFIEEYLLDWDRNIAFPKHRKDWKVTIIVENSAKKEDANRRE